MRRLLIAAIVLAGAIGASVFAARHFEAEKLTQARSQVLATLKDPLSAQFRNEHLNEGVLCGELNSRNSMGGYVGFTRFVSTPNDWALEGSGHSKWERFETDLLIAELKADTAMLNEANTRSSGDISLPSDRARQEVRDAAGFQFVWSKMCGPA